jgi:ComEC/Rec2-related protein
LLCWVAAWGLGAALVGGGGRPAPEWGPWPWLLATVLLGAAGARWWFGTGATAGLRGPWPWILAAALVVSSARTADVAPLPFGAERGAERAPARVANASALLAEGVYRARGAEFGRLGGPGGLPYGLQFTGPPPGDGERIALLRPGERRPFARGPVPGPAARAGVSLGTWLVAPDELVRLAPAPGAGGVGAALAAALAAPIARWREAILWRAECIGLTGDRGLAPALLVGDTGALDRELGDLFTRTGTRHFLALSGQHVGLLALCALWPLGRLVERMGLGLGLRSRGAARCRDGARLGALALFAALAGGSPPVVRATVALSAAVLAGHVPLRPGDEPGRRADGLSLWALALSLELAADPAALSRLSVTLSYAATLGILCAALAVSRWFDRGGAVARRRRQELRWHRPWPWVALAVCGERVGRVLVASIGCSVAAVLATLPLTWVTFGEFAPLGALATVAALPAITLLLLGNWLALALGPGAAVEGVRAIEGALQALLEHVDRWPGTPLGLPPRSLWLTATAAIATLGGIAARSRALGVGAGLALLALVCPWARPVEGLRIDVLDVGHGTCALVRAPGARPLLFDAGSRDRPGLVSEALAPLLRSAGIRELDVVLSHTDRDHHSALAWVLGRVEVRRWFGACTPDYTAALGATPRFDLPGPGRLTVQLGPALEGTLLRGSVRPGNEGSRSLLLEWRGRRVLLCGDAVDEGLLGSLAAGHLEPPFDLCLLPHHGTHGAGVPALIERLRGSRLWWSASDRPAVVDELLRQGFDCAGTGLPGPGRPAGGPLSLSFAPRNPDPGAD